MNRGYTKAQFVGLITLIFIGLIILFAGVKIVNYINRPEAKEVLQNVNVKQDGFTLAINGEFVTYVGINEKYEEAGAKAYKDGKNISSKIAVSYYKDDRQVSYIDTKDVCSYVVKYEVYDGNVLKETTRVVIVKDNKAPRLTVPDTVTITSDEVINYDVSAGVLATDNSGKVKFDCDNNLARETGNYIIECIAEDNVGNKTVKKRLIKVIPGIEFEDNGKVMIKYPKGEGFSYKYSLDDGKSWKDASITESLDVSGNVIALVLENGEYKMSKTYYKK